MVFFPIDDNWGDVIRKAGVDLAPDGKRKIAYALRQLILDSDGNPITADNPLNVQPGVGGDPVTGTNPLPVYNVEVGTPKYLDVSDDSEPGVEQTLLDISVPATKLWRLRNFTLNCRQQAYWELHAQLSAGDTIIASGLTFPHPESKFPFIPFRPLGGSTRLWLIFQQLAGTPVSGIQAHLQLNELDE